MRDESMNRTDDREATPEGQMAAFGEQEAAFGEQEAAFAREFDLRVVRMLEDAPAVEIPSDFSARVAARVPSRPGAVYGRAGYGHAVSIRRTNFGYVAMLLSAVALVASLVLLAAHGRGGLGHPGVVLMVEWLLFAQLTGLAVWLSLRRASLR